MGRRRRGPAAGRHRRPQRTVRVHGAPGLIAVDTNIPGPAPPPQPPRHEDALAALREVSTGSRSWGLPVFVVGEFVRLVTHPTLFDYPSSLDDALAALRGPLEARRARLLRPGRRYWPILQQVAVDGHTHGEP